MSPGRSPIARSAVSTPGVNEARSSESCRIVRVSPDAAQDHLLVRHQAPHPQAVHPDPVHVGAAGAVQGGAVASGTGGQPGLAPGGRDQLGGTPRRTGRRVRLVRVVQLDHLDRLEERRGRDREPHHQHRADREVGRDQHPGLRGVGQPPLTVASRSSSNPVVPTTAWMPWSMQNSRLSMTASGWVKSTTACALGRRPAARARRRRRARRRARGRRRRRPRGTPRCRPCPAPRAPRPVVPLHAGPNLVRTGRAPVLAASGRYAPIWQGGSHGGAADPGPDPVGRGLHGRPAERPRPRDRLWTRRRRRADLHAGWRPASCSPSTAPSRAWTAPGAGARSSSRPAGSRCARSTWPPCGCR